MRVRIILVAGGLAVLAAIGGCGSSDGGAPSTTHAAPSVDAGSAATVDAAPDPIDAALPDDAAPAPDASTVLPCAGRVKQPLDQTLTVMSKGTTRTAHLHVPKSYDPSKPTPVVLNFHGFSSNSPEQEILTNMTAKSDAEGFVVVYPDGLGSSWNAGACCGTSASTKVDDVAFVSDMIDALQAQLCVDERRVFATGFSNGGFLSHKLACELSTRIAAIAPVSGVLAPPLCMPTRPVPVLHFHGTADAIVPYEGNSAMGFTAAPDTFAGWGARNGCSGAPVETFRKSDAHCASFTGCLDNATTTLCTIDNGGHSWPGGFPVAPLGYTSMNIVATDVIWTFFHDHPMP